MLKKLMKYEMKAIGRIVFLWYLDSIVLDLWHKLESDVYEL